MTSRAPYVFSIRAGDPYHDEHDKRNMVCVTIGYAGLKSAPFETDYIEVAEAIALIAQLAEAVAVVTKRKAKL